MAYVHDISLIGDDIRTIERNTDVLFNAYKDIGLAVNIGKTEYMQVGRHRDMMANEHMAVGNNSYKQCNDLGSLLTNKNSIHEKIKCIHKARNSYYYSVQTLVCSISKNLKLKYTKSKPYFFIK